MIFRRSTIFFIKKDTYPKRFQLGKEDSLCPSHGAGSKQEKPFLWTSSYFQYHTCLNSSLKTIKNLNNLLRLV